MKGFIELSGHETGVRYVVNVGHIVSVINSDSGTSMLLLSNGTEMAVRESGGDIMRRIDAMEDSRCQQ